jgi:DNA-binding transcriptional MerR regulator
MMRIGDLAAKAGITTRTLRYYQELGIIEPDEHTQGGFRLYSEEQLRRLHIIQSLKSLGFDLERIRALFNLRNTVETGGDLAREMIDQLRLHQQQVEAKIAEYEAMKARNTKAIEVLGGCLCCCIRVFERDCRTCEVYQQHADVPDVVDCAIYGH